jgi:hypothetical protein
MAKRKNKTFWVIIILLMVLVGILYLTAYKKTNYQVVRLKGAESYANYSKSNVTWWAANTVDSLSALPVYDKDLIYMMKDDDFTYRYLITDGRDLKFSMEDFKYFLNGHLISINIDESEGLQDWMKHLSTREIKDLRSLYISGDIPDDYINYLSEIAVTKPRLGIILSGNSLNADKLFDIFDPEWLFAPGFTLDNKLLDKILQSKHLELICMNITSLEEVNKLSVLPDLKTLMIYDMRQPADGETIELNDHLESLSLIKSGIRNLDFLRHSSFLKELYCFGCDSLTDISRIRDINTMRFLSFAMCDSLTDIAVVNRIPSLLWFSFPVKTDQDAFKAFFPAHKDIRVIELTGCVNIHDLQPLKTLKHLKGVIVSGMNLDTTTFPVMKNLNYLSLPDKYLESDTTRLSRLHATMPFTTIIPNSVGGLCLGSGRLLLFIPLLVLVGAIFIIIRKRWP